MPMELYSSEAFVRDIVNAISKSEGKPLNLGGSRHQGIDRGYAFQLISEARKAVEGSFGHSAPSPASKVAAARTAAIKKLMAKTEVQEAAAKPRRSPPTNTKKTRPSPV